MITLRSSAAWQTGAIDTPIRQEESSNKKGGQVVDCDYGIQKIGEKEQGEGEESLKKEGGAEEIRAPEEGRAAEEKART